MDIRSFNQAIRSFDNNQQELGINFDKAIVTLNGKKLALDKPLMAPSRWTSFLGSLSSNTVLGKWQSVINAKETCKAYASYTANTNAVREGFIKALNAQYDNALSSLCELPPANGKPLSAKTVAITLATIKKNCPPHNNKRINIFADKLLATLETEKKLPTLDKQNKTMLEDAILARCKKLDSYSTEMVEIKDMFVEAEKVISFYSALRREVAGTDTSPKQQAEIFKQLCELPEPTAALPKALILSSAESMLKDNSPASKLNQLALQNGVSQDLVKTIVQAKLEQVVASISVAPHSQLLQLQATLMTKIEAALNEHSLALNALEESSKLTENQKTELRKIAVSAPLDRSQITQFELLSETLKNPTATESKSQSGPAIPAEVIAFENALDVIKQSAAGGWTAGSPMDSDQRTYALIQQLVFVAVAGLSKNEANTALEKLGSSLVIEPSLEVVSPTANAVWRPAIGKLLQQSLRNQNQNSAELTATDFTSLTLESAAQAPSQQLSSMLTRQDEIDVRGVTKKAVISSPVSADFRAGVVFSNMRTEILNYITSDTLENNLSVTMNKDITRARFSINGELINAALINGARKTPALETSIKTSFNSKLKISGENLETIKAISFCMNQKGINRFNEACTVQAMNGALATESSNIEHEAWKQVDHSWIVRSSYSFKPAMISKEDGNIPIEGDGIGLYSLTYRITPQAGGKAQITLEGYTAAYDF